FVVRTTTVDGATYRYQVFVPRHAGGGGRPPVILYLHGAGERGADGALQTMVGLGPVVKGRAESFPAVVVLPQAPRDTVWGAAPRRRRRAVYRVRGCRTQLLGIGVQRAGAVALVVRAAARPPVPPGALKQSMRAQAAVGFRVKSGWATAVLLVGPARAPRVADRRVIELSDPAVPTPRQPYHAVMGAAPAHGANPERRLRSVVARITRRSVRRLLHE